MFGTINNIDLCVSDDISGLPITNLKFYKTFKDHKKGDYICHLPSSIEKDLITPQIIGDLVEKSRPWLKGFIDVEISSDRITIFLVRSGIYYHGLRNVLSQGLSYGRDSIKENFSPDIVVDGAGDNKDRLTQFRVEVVSKFLMSLSKFSSSSCCKAGNRELLVSSRHKVDPECFTVILVGPVLDQTGKLSTITVDEYNRLRRKEIMKMCEHKLESNMVGDVEVMARATEVFDMLQKTTSRAVTLHVDPRSTKPSCKGALFVLYNYVRLSSICQKFDQQVASGLYPSLPPVEEVDFSVLTNNEDEWRLLFDFVLYWPEVVAATVSDIGTGRPKLHMVPRFLISLASQFSLYYRHTRILTDGRTHLIPMLIARMYLLLALKNVFLTALSILSIDPPLRM